MSFKRVQPESGASVRRLVLFLVPFVLLSAGAGVVDAQEATFACVQTAPGDSADAAHTGWIDAYGLDHGSANPPGGSASSFTEVSILKGTDSASVRLNQLAAARLSVP